MILKLCRAFCDFVYMVGDSTHHHCPSVDDRYATTLSNIRYSHATESSVATLLVKIASPEGLGNTEDMESLGTVLGIQLRHTGAQSPFDIILHESSFSRTLLHYLYTCCTHDSIGLPGVCEAQCILCTQS